jgi:tetratricopeptide (TPR) repeat protein
VLPVPRQTQYRVLTCKENYSIIQSANIKEKTMMNLISGIPLRKIIALLLMMFVITTFAAKPPKDNDWKILNDQVDKLYKQKKYNQAIETAIKAIAIGEKTFGINHPNVGISLNNLAFTYDTVGKYKEADPIYTRVITIIKSNIGQLNEIGPLMEWPDDEVRCQALEILFKQAEIQYKSALKIREKTFGNEEVEVAICLHNIGWIYFAPGSYEKAEPYFHRELKIKEKTFGTDSIELLPIIDCIARINFSTNNFSQTELWYKRSLEIAEKEYGQNSDKLLPWIEKLALWYCLSISSTGIQAENFKSGELLYKRLLNIAEKSENIDKEILLQYIYKCYYFYNVSGDYIQAESLCKKIISATDKINGPDFYGNAENYNFLAKIYYKQKQYSNTEESYKKALSLTEIKFGLDSTENLQYLCNLSKLYSEQGKDTLAIPLYKRIFLIGEKITGLNNSMLASDENGPIYIEHIMSKLSDFYRKEKDYASEEDLLIKAIHYYELNKSEGLILANLISLSKLYIAQSKFVNADAVDKRIIILAKKIFEPFRIDILEQLQGVESLYINIGKTSKVNEYEKCIRELIDKSKR